MTGDLLSIAQANLKLSADSILYHLHWCLLTLIFHYLLTKLGSKFSKLITTYNLCQRDYKTKRKKTGATYFQVILASQEFVTDGANLNSSHAHLWCNMMNLTRN